MDPASLGLVGVGGDDPIFIELLCVYEVGGKEADEMSIAANWRFGEVVLDVVDDITVEGFNGADESARDVRSFVDEVEEVVLVSLEVEVGYCQNRRGVSVESEE